MRGRRIGLDIGATGVRAAELSMRTVPPTLVRVEQVALPTGAVANGELREPREVTEALRELWRKGRFRTRQVILGVGNQRVVVREVSLPWLPDMGELRQSLPYQVQEFVPIPLEDAVLDFQILEEFEQEGRRMLRVLLVAAQREMIQQMVAAVEAARLHPVGLDLIPFALVRSTGSIDGSGLSDAEMGDEALVDVGADMTSICVHAWGVPRFVRMLPLGGRAATTAVAKAMGVTEDEAEQLKLDDPDGREPGEAQAAAAAQAEAFANEIRSSLEFYLTQMPGTRIGRILLTGGGSRLADLDRLLEERLPAEVAQGRPFHRVNTRLDLDPAAMAEAEPLLAVAVGLALPGMRG